MRSLAAPLAAAPLAVLLLALALPAMAEVAPPRAIALEHIVLQDCGSCHGMTLKGGLGSALTVEALKDIAPEQLAEVILDGRPGTAMPGWSPVLTEQEAMWIAHYLLKDEK